VEAGIVKIVRSSLEKMKQRTTSNGRVIIMAEEFMLLFEALVVVLDKLVDTRYTRIESAEEFEDYKKDVFALRDKIDLQRRMDASDYD
jgi:hypothetical protein